MTRLTSKGHCMGPHEGSTLPLNLAFTQRRGKVHPRSHSPVAAPPYRDAILLDTDLTSKQADFASMSRDGRYTGA